MGCVNVKSKGDNKKTIKLMKPIGQEDFDQINHGKASHKNGHGTEQTLSEINASKAIDMGSNSAIHILNKGNGKIDNQKSDV